MILAIMMIVYYVRSMMTSHNKDSKPRRRAKFHGNTLAEQQAAFNEFRKQRVARKQQSSKISKESALNALHYSTHPQLFRAKDEHS